MSDLLQMCDLMPGRAGTVVSLGRDTALTRRLLDLGLTEGSRVECVGRSLWGDPSAYRICGAVIVLRRRDCAQVCLRRTEI